MRRREDVGFARGEMEHALCPLAAVAGASGALFGQYLPSHALANLNIVFFASVSASRRVA
jgi:hypothetical protein